MGFGKNKHACICVYVFKGENVGLVANVTEEVQILRNRVQLLEKVKQTP